MLRPEHLPSSLEGTNLLGVKVAETFLQRLLTGHIFAGRRRLEPVRETSAYPTMFQMGQQRATSKVVWKPIPRNLRYFSRTPYARRAINAIKNPIAMLNWEIVPKKGVKLNPELERQIELVTYCLEHPNHSDSWRMLCEQLIEDVLIGAGAAEIQLSGDKQRPIWLFPVDGLSIQMYPTWNGDKNDFRYAQVTGSGTYSAGSTTVNLTDDELLYLRPNPNTANPFGLGPLEVAFTSISRMLGVSEFAGNVTSNAKPSIMLDLGIADQTAVAAYRSYWRNDVEGQGTMPIVSTNGSGKIHRLYPEGDNSLYLKYQELLKSEIAIAFDLSPMNLGVERDVNRNTADVSKERDWDAAIKPCASMLASQLTRHVIHRAFGFYQLEFKFIGLDIEDDKLLADTFKLEWECGATTPNLYREQRGRPPLESQYADMTGVDVSIAREAARGAATVYDENLGEGKAAKPSPPDRKKEPK